MKPVIHFVSFVCFAAFLGGCSPADRPQVKTTPVSGTVLVDGQPFANAQVNFLNSDYAGIGTTDEAGKYQMEAQPGENKVYIVKFDDPNYDETMVGGSDTAGSAPKQVLPPKYSSSENSELRFSVPDDGSTEANFDLSSR
jgi:hypothetical protein